MLTLHINGQTQIFDGDPSMPLLWYLRDVLGLTGTKFGCGVAACGACTVHLDGDARAFLPDADERRERQDGHHHRRARARRQSSGSDRLAGA